MFTAYSADSSDSMESINSADNANHIEMSTAADDSPTLQSENTATTSMDRGATVVAVDVDLPRNDMSINLTDEPSNAAAMNKRKKISK